MYIECSVWLTPTSVDRALGAKQVTQKKTEMLANTEGDTFRETREEEIRKV